MGFVVRNFFSEYSLFKITPRSWCFFYFIIRLKAWLTNYLKQSLSCRNTCMYSCQNCYKFIGGKGLLLQLNHNYEYYVKFVVSCYFFSKFWSSQRLYYALCSYSVSFLHILCLVYRYVSRFYPLQFEKRNKSGVPGFFHTKNMLYNSCTV